MRAWIRSVSLIISLLALTCVAVARQISAAEPTEAVGQGGFVTLRGNVRPEAKAANDRGRVSDDFVLHHLMLQLRRTTEREQELEQFLKDVLDPTSPQFHHWLTAEEFGHQFGVDSAEIAKVRNWLESRDSWSTPSIPVK